MPRPTPEFPIYVPTKGRADSRLTIRSLDHMGVDHFVVVEEQERDDYAAGIGQRSEILVLDPDYQRSYDVLCDLEPGQSKGSGPARNFIWDHAKAAGHSHHWVVDDNIRWWCRLNRNAKVKFADGVVFRVMEDFVLRYANVALAGPHYEMFVPRRQKASPFHLNTRIYSCILVRNDLPFRWRGRWNEDTILSLDVLKAGWCTVLFNAFLAHKIRTQLLKGGNTDELYRDGTLAKSEMLARVHPDVAKVTWRFGRWHHHVDYRPFRKNKLVRRKHVEIPKGVNEYGMRLVHLGLEGAAA